MKKLGLLSVAAAVAVAGLGTSAFAKPMEEAIKGVDVSGYVRYRFTNDAGTTNDGETGSEDKKSSAHTNKYKTVIQFKSKVNEMTTATVKFANESTLSDANGETGDADPTHAAVKLANFAFNVGGNTIIAGKQSLATPFADGADQQGTGVVALMPMGGVTLAAGWYDNSDALAGQVHAVADSDESNLSIGTNNITALGLIGKAGMINYSAWYAMVSENQLNKKVFHLKADGSANIADVTAGATAMNVNVSGKFGPVSAEINHAAIDYTVKANGTKNDGLSYSPTQTRVVLGAMGAAFGYVMTADAGGDVTLGDTGAAANFELEQASASALSDAALMYIGYKGKAGKTSFGVEYLTGDGYASPLATGSRGANEKKTDVMEAKLSLGYSMSDNFSVSSYYSTSTLETGTGKNNNDQARIEMKYSF